MVLYKMKKSVKAINISGLGESSLFPGGWGMGEGGWGVGDRRWEGVGCEVLTLITDYQ